jgi:hypothetical protein
MNLPSNHFGDADYRLRAHAVIRVHPDRRGSNAVRRQYTMSEQAVAVAMSGI